MDTYLANQDYKATWALQESVNSEKRPGVRGKQQRNKTILLKYSIIIFVPNFIYAFRWTSVIVLYRFYVFVWWMGWFRRFK